jgi:hypothetical protein
MSFVIDTGVQQRGLRDRLPDWFLDQQADTATDAQLSFAYGQWIISEAMRPKLAATVRDHLLAKWWVLPIIAEHHPEVFDEIFTTYALRVEGVEA